WAAPRPRPANLRPHPTGGRSRHAWLAPSARGARQAPVRCRTWSAMDPDAASCGSGAGRDGEAAGLQDLLGPGVLPAIARRPLGLGGSAVALAAFPVAAVEDHLHRLAGELLLQVLVELDVVARDDQELPEPHQPLRGLSRPESNVHLAERRQGQAQMLLGQLALAPLLVAKPQREMDARLQRAHLELLGQGQRFAVR